MEAKEIYDVSSLATVQSAFIRLVLHTIRYTIENFFSMLLGFSRNFLTKTPSKYVTRVTK